MPVVFMMPVQKPALIQRPVTFVLGAGASMPYGFPSGRTLATKLLQAPTRDSFFFGMSPDEKGLFLKAHATFADALRGSRIETIDEFLRGRQDLMRIGKSLIAMHILESEDQYTRTAEIIADEADDWLRLLWNNIKAPPGDFEKQPIRFITFNYDRLLEHYIINAMMHSYNCSWAEASKSVLSNPIIHLHGRLGRLHSLTEPRVPNDLSHKSVLMGANLSYELLQRVGADCSLWWQDETEADLSETAARILESSNHVYMLGVGQAIQYFDSLARRFMNGRQRSQQPWFVTSYKASQSLRSRIERTLGGLSMLLPDSFNCTQTLDQYMNCDELRRPR
jgi:hypothetical protein